METSQYHPAIFRKIFEFIGFPEVSTRLYRINQRFQEEAKKFIKWTMGSLSICGADYKAMIQAEHSSKILAYFRKLLFKVENLQRIQIEYTNDLHIRSNILAILAGATTCDCIQEQTCCRHRHRSPITELVFKSVTTEPMRKSDYFELCLSPGGYSWCESDFILTSLLDILADKFGASGPCREHVGRKGRYLHKPRTTKRKYLRMPVSHGPSRSIRQGSSLESADPDESNRRRLSLDSAEFSWSRGTSLESHYESGANRNPDEELMDYFEDHIASIGGLNIDTSQSMLPESEDYQSYDGEIGSTDSGWSGPRSLGRRPTLTVAQNNPEAERMLGDSITSDLRLSHFWHNVVVCSRCQSYGRDPITFSDWSFILNWFPNLKILDLDLGPYDDPNLIQFQPPIDIERDFKYPWPPNPIQIEILKIRNIVSDNCRFSRGVLPFPELKELHLEFRGHSTVELRSILSPSAAEFSNSVAYCTSLRILEIIVDSAPEDKNGRTSDRQETASLLILRLFEASTRSHNDSQAPSPEPKEFRTSIPANDYVLQDSARSGCRFWIFPNVHTLLVPSPTTISPEILPKACPNLRVLKCQTVTDTLDVQVRLALILEGCKNLNLLQIETRSLVSEASDIHDNKAKIQQLVLDFNCRVATNYEIRKWSEYLDTLCSSRRTSGINALGIIVENLFRQLRNCWDVSQYPASTAVASPIILDVFKFRSKREVKMKMLDIMKNRRIGTPILPGTDEFKFIKAFYNYSLNSSTEISSFHTDKTDDILRLVAALPDSSTVIIDLDTIYKRIPDAQNDAVREVICNRIFRFIQYYKASHAGLLLDAALHQRPMTEFHRDSKSFVNVFSTTEAVLNYLKGLIFILQKTSPVATSQSPPAGGVSLESLDYTSVHWSFKRLFVEYLASIENEAPSGLTCSEDFEPELFNHWRQNEISRLMIVINDTSGRFNPEAKIKAQAIANDYEQLKTIHQKIKTSWDINPVKAKIDEAFHTAVLYIQNEFQTKKSLFIRKQTFVRYFGASLLLKSQITDFDDNSSKFSAQTTEKVRGTGNQRGNDLGLLSDTSSLSDSDGAANPTNLTSNDDSTFKLMDITFELYLPIFEKFSLNAATNSIAMLYFFMVNQNFSVFHKKFVETLMDRFRESENINEKIKCTEYIVSFCCRSARIEAPVIEDIINSLIEPLHSSVVAMEKLSTVTGGESTSRGILGTLPGTQRMMPLYETIFNGILEVMATRWKLLQHDASTDCLIRIICILASTESTLEILVTTPTDIASRTHNQLKDFDFSNFEPIQTFVDLLANKGNLPSIEWPARPFDRVGLYHFEKMICHSQFWYDWNADPPIAQPPVALDTVKLQQIWDKVTAPKHKLVEITLLPGSTNHETKLLPRSLDLVTPKNPSPSSLRPPEKTQSVKSRHASPIPLDLGTVTLDLGTVPLDLGTLGRSIPISPTVNRPESPIPATPSLSCWENRENVDDYVDLETPKKNTTKQEGLSSPATKRFRLSSNSSSSQDTTASRSVKAIQKEAVENVPPLTDEKRIMKSPVPSAMEPIETPTLRPDSSITALATPRDQNVSPSNHSESSFSPDERPADNLFKTLERRTESPQIATHRSSLETRLKPHDDVWTADLSYSPILSESEGLVTPRIANPAPPLQTFIMLEKIVETNQQILIQSQKNTELNSIVSQTLKSLADFIAKQQPLKSRQVTRAVNLAIHSTMQIKCEPNVAVPCEHLDSISPFKASTNEDLAKYSDLEQHRHVTVATTETKSKKRKKDRAHKDSRKKRKVDVVEDTPVAVVQPGDIKKNKHRKSDSPEAVEDKRFSGLTVVSQKLDEKDLAPETEAEVRRSSKKKSKGRSEKSVREKKQPVKQVTKADSTPLCSIETGAIGVGIERGIAAGDSGLLYGLPQKCDSKKASVDLMNGTRPGIQVKEEDVGGWGKLLSAGFDYAQSMISLSSSEGKSQPRTQCGRRRRIRLLEAAANRL